TRSRADAVSGSALATTWPQPAKPALFSPRRLSSELAVDVLAQVLLGDLADAGQRERVDHLESLRQLEFRDLLCMQERDELRQGQTRTRPQDDVGAGALTEDRVRHGHRGHVEHTRVGKDQVFDLLGRDLLTATVDQVLRAALDDQVAELAESHDITTAVVAVAGEGT